MDANKIFRQLTSGISFDKKKYRNDAQLFGLTKGQLSDNYITDEKNYLLIDDNHSNGNASDESESNSTPDSVENDEDDDFKLLSNEIKLTKTKAPKKKRVHLNELCHYYSKNDCNRILGSYQEKPTHAYTRKTFMMLFI